MNLTGNEQPADVIGEILNIVHNSVILVDPAERIFFANTMTAKMFRASPEQLNRLDFSELFMPEDRQFMLPNILRLTRRKQEFETEIMLRCLDGGSFLGILFCSIFRWEDDECIAVTIHDSSRMKTIERTLRRSERVAFLGNMLDEISHQIRNPIQVIGGLARRMKGKAGAHERYMETIIHESIRLEKLLDTLNAFIKLPRPKTSMLPLTELLRIVKPRLEKIAAQYEINLQYHCDETILDKSILADLALIAEAMEAAVINACESYSKKDPANLVEFRLFDLGQPDWPCAIRITDHGCGIKAENLPQITTHFFTNKTGHLGMGLTFAQRIVEEQDGRLEIISVEGQGTCVTFFLKKERRRPLRTERLE
ncbi:MAG: hypothetical protein A2505_08205 [Deltaproteobacteria bacterium RIFOXYD12_FULL_55_16]|nr:MAG: hypothetical protein A2505_08205 [Deltaproteobacteria bacterium RIFOXYD12_FULL_55_16]